MNKKPELITHRLVLKSIEDKDQASMIKMLNDPKIKKTYMLPDLESKEQENNFFDKLKDLTTTKEHIVYGIYHADRLIGFINDVCMTSDSVEVGYFIDSDEWNKGYATEALWAYMKQVFEMGFFTLEAAYFEGNDASRKVMEKCCLHPSGKQEIINYRGQDLVAIYYQINKRQFLPLYEEKQLNYIYCSLTQIMVLKHKFFCHNSDGKFR